MFDLSLIPLTDRVLAKPIVPECAEFSPRAIPKIGTLHPPSACGRIANAERFFRQWRSLDRVKGRCSDVFWRVDAARPASSRPDITPWPRRAMEHFELQRVDSVHCNAESSRTLRRSPFCFTEDDFTLGVMPSASALLS